MTDHPSARFQGRVAALNRSRDRLDAARDRLVSLDVFGYRIAPGGVPGAFNVHDRHGRHVGRFMPDGRFQRSSVKGADKFAPGFAVALRMLAAQVDDTGADYVPAVAIGG